MFSKENSEEKCVHMTVALLVLSLIVEDGQALEVRRSLRLRFNVVRFVLGRGV